MATEKELRSGLTAERVRELFDYNPETGVLTRRTSTSPNARAGGEAPAGFLGTGKCRYCRLMIDGTSHLNHRICWLHYYGVWPTGDIDHVDHITYGFGNRISNLRDVSHMENMQNITSPHCDSKSGVLGVSWNSRRNNWDSSIRANGKRISLGAYNSIEAARQARVAAENLLRPYYSQQSRVPA